MLESEGDDPMGPYVYKATFTPPSEAQGGNGTAYQPSPFLVDGHLYLAVSSPHTVPAHGNLKIPRLFVKKMDNPWDTSADWNLLNDPTTCWEGETLACLVVPGRDDQ